MTKTIYFVSKMLEPVCGSSQKPEKQLWLYESPVCSGHTHTSWV